MTSPCRLIEVYCPACGESYETVHRASFNFNLEQFTDEHIREMTTGSCPRCKAVVNLGGLVVRERGPMEFGHGYSEYLEAKSFQDTARARQVWYRENVLGVPARHDHASRLGTESALRGLNFYRAWPGLLDLVAKRFPLGDKPLYYNMLRSEHVPFNFFGPLALPMDSSFTHAVIRWLAPEMHRVTTIRFEYAPPRAKAVLQDNTSFDVYVEYEVATGEQCALGIEIKYTEGAYPYGDRERARMFAESSPYHEVTGDKLYAPDSIPRLRKRDLKQLWRNHLLGEALGVHRFRSVFIHPRGNAHAARASHDYARLLRPERRNEFLPVTHEDWLAVLQNVAATPAERAWVGYLSERYAIRIRDEPRRPRRPFHTVTGPTSDTFDASVTLELPASTAALRGNWQAMPSVTTMDDMQMLALSIDAYRTAPDLGFGDAGELFLAREAEFASTGRYSGTAAELWCCLFFLQRRYRHADWPGRQPDEEKHDFDAIYSALITRLQAGDDSVEALGDRTFRMWG